MSQSRIAILFLSFVQLSCASQPKAFDRGKGPFNFQLRVQSVKPVNSELLSDSRVDMHVYKILESCNFDYLGYLSANNGEKLEFSLPIDSNYAISFDLVRIRYLRQNAIFQGGDKIFAVPKANSVYSIVYEFSSQSRELKYYRQLKDGRLELMPDSDFKKVCHP